jgi:hypothetical protein
VPSLTDLAVIAIALGGLLVVAWLMPRHPVTAVGVVFMLACLSDVSVKLPLGQMRLEQPALAGLIALTFWHRKKLELPPIKPLIPIIVAGLVYLGALTLSSFFVAPDPPVSIRVLAWSYLSMTGGLAAALLLAGSAPRAMAWFTRDAGLLATIGFLSAIAFALFAVGAPWIDGAHTSLPRVSPFVIEPNLYASLLAAITPLAIERWRARPSLLRLLVAAVFLATLGLAVTRGAYIGLVAGLVVYFGLLLRLKLGSAGRLGPVLLLVLVVGGIGLVLPKVLLNPHHAGVLTATPTTNTTPLPPAQEDLDTFEYRMVRVRIGLQEWTRCDPRGTGPGAARLGHHRLGRVAHPARAHWPAPVAHRGGQGAWPYRDRLRRGISHPARRVRGHGRAPFRDHVADIRRRPGRDHDLAARRQRDHGRPNGTQRIVLAPDRTFHRARQAQALRGVHAPDGAAGRRTRARRRHHRRHVALQQLL